MVSLLRYLCSALHRIPTVTVCLSAMLPSVSASASATATASAAHLISSHDTHLNVAIYHMIHYTCQAQLRM